MPTIGHNCIMDPDVTIHDDVAIGDNVVLKGRITIDSGTRIDSGCVIRGTVHIGRDNWIYPHCVIGTGPQHTSFADSYPYGSGRIIIGDRNIIREFTTIHLPTKSEPTRVHSDCYVMSYGHIAHDCVLHDHVIMSTRITLGGHVHIHEYANIGQGADIHPYCRLGKHAMIGMGCPIVKDVPPFALINRMKFTKINRVGLERHGVSRQDIDGIDAYYRGATGGDAWYVRDIESFMAGSTKKFYKPNF